MIDRLIHDSIFRVRGVPETVSSGGVGVPRYQVMTMLRYDYGSPACDLVRWTLLMMLLSPRLQLGDNQLSRPWVKALAGVQNGSLDPHALPRRIRRFPSLPHASGAGETCVAFGRRRETVSSVVEDNSCYG